jgi:GNAT superfamily N-acetyltransferase
VVITSDGCFDGGAIPVTTEKRTTPSTPRLHNRDMPDTLSALPEGLTTRPLTKADSRILFELIAAQEMEDAGEADIEEADLVSDWAKPSHDVSASSVAVFDGDRLVAYAELMGADRADTAVLPSYRGRGIGTWLAAWLRALGTSRGSSVVGMPVPQGSAGDRLLAALGYRIRWTSWVLALPEGTQIEHRDLPPGYVVREAVEADYRDAHEVLEDAFLEWSVRERESYEDFAGSTFSRPGFAPWNIRVAVDAAGAVVGVSLVLISTESPTAYISKLAVRKDQRNRGIAQALLVDSFDVAREHGATVSELSTDSRTGALGLYEKVGMVTQSVWVNRAIDL